MIIGGGVVGINVVKMVVGFGVDVIIIDLNVDCLCQFDDIFGYQIKMLIFNLVNIVDVVVEVDFFICVVLILGVKVLIFVIEEMVK